MRKDKVDITPDTKVADLLKDYPQLEDTLQQFSPAFAALRNPVLRRTVAKVTSLQQAAKVGGVAISDMVNTLRAEVGLSSLLDASTDNDVQSAASLQMPSSPVVATLDVRPIIDSGDQPKDAVLKSAEELRSNESLLLISPFPPIPLIDALRKRGFKIIMHPPQDGLVKTYVERVE